MQPYPMLRRLIADLYDDILIISLLPSLMLDEQSEEVRREFPVALGDRRPRVVVLDLSQVTMISSIGVGAVMGMQRRVREGGGELVLCGLTPLVDQAFRLCRLVASDGGKAIFRVFPAVDSAVASLLAAQ
jgi:anti-anti-sigma factor